MSTTGLPLRHHIQSQKYVSLVRGAATWRSAMARVADSVRLPTQQQHRQASSSSSSSWRDAYTGLGAKPIISLSSAVCHAAAFQLGDHGDRLLDQKKKNDLLLQAGAEGGGGVRRDYDASAAGTTIPNDKKECDGDDDDRRRRDARERYLVHVAEHCFNQTKAALQLCMGDERLLASQSELLSETCIPQAATFLYRSMMRSSSMWQQGIESLLAAQEKLLLQDEQQRQTAATSRFGGEEEKEQRVAVVAAEQTSIEHGLAQVLGGIRLRQNVVESLKSAVAFASVAAAASRRNGNDDTASSSSLTLPIPFLRNLSHWVLVEIVAEKNDAEKLASFLHLIKQFDEAYRTVPACSLISSLVMKQQFTSHLLSHHEPLQIKSSSSSSKSVVAPGDDGGVVGGDSTSGGEQQHYSHSNTQREMVSDFLYHEGFNVDRAYLSEEVWHALRNQVVVVDESDEGNRSNNNTNNNAALFKTLKTFIAGSTPSSRALHLARKYFSYDLFVSDVLPSSSTKHDDGDNNTFLLPTKEQRYHILTSSLNLQRLVDENMLDVAVEKMRRDHVDTAIELYEKYISFAVHHQQQHYDDSQKQQQKQGGGGESNNTKNTVDVDVAIPSTHIDSPRQRHLLHALTKYEHDFKRRRRGFLKDLEIYLEGAHQHVVDVISMKELKQFEKNEFRRRSGKTLHDMSDEAKKREAIVKATLNLGVVSIPVSIDDVIREGLVAGGLQRHVVSDYSGAGVGGSGGSSSSSGSGRHNNSRLPSQKKSTNTNNINTHWKLDPAAVIRYLDSLAPHNALWRRMTTEFAENNLTYQKCCGLVRVIDILFQNKHMLTSATQKASVIAVLNVNLERFVENRLMGITNMLPLWKNKNHTVVISKRDSIGLETGEQVSMTAVRPQRILYRDDDVAVVEKPAAFSTTGSASDSMLRGQDATCLTSHVLSSQLWRTSPVAKAITSDFFSAASSATTEQTSSSSSSSSFHRQQQFEPHVDFFDQHPELVRRCGVTSRLDKGTSGYVVYALTNDAMRRLKSGQKLIADVGVKWARRLRAVSAPSPSSSQLLTGGGANGSIGPGTSDNESSPDELKSLLGELDDDNGDDIISATTTTTASNSNNSPATKTGKSPLRLTTTADDERQKNIEAASFLDGSDLGDVTLTDIAKHSRNVVADKSTAAAAAAAATTTTPPIMSSRGGRIWKHYYALVVRTTHDDDGDTSKKTTLPFSFSSSSSSPQSGVISLPLHGGQSALTRFKFLKHYKSTGMSLVRCSICTGRRHQIRLHMSSIGCPIANDVIVGGPVAATNLFGGGRVLGLHLYESSFVRPSDGERVCVTMPLPEEFAEALERLEKQEEEDVV